MKEVFIIIYTVSSLVGGIINPNPPTQVMIIENEVQLAKAIDGIPGYFKSIKLYKAIPITFEITYTEEKELKENIKRIPHITLEVIK